MKHETSCAVPKEDRWLTDYWYETLEDPPEPPPRETSCIITVTLNPDPPNLSILSNSAPFPSGEGWGEASKASEASPLSILRQSSPRPKAKSMSRAH